MITFQDLVEKVSKETGYSEELVKLCIRHKFSWLREKLKSNTEVAIFDQFWGTYFISEKRVYRYVKNHPEDETFKDILERVKKYNQSRKKDEKS